MRDRIIHLVSTLGLTQKKFVEGIGITAGGLTDYIKGRSRDLSSSTISKIVEKYRVNGNWLLTGEGEMFIDEKSSKPLTVAQEDGPYGVEPSRTGLASKNRLRAIDGNVQEYPDIDIIEKISRTKWWRNLSEEDRVVIAHLILVKDKDLKKKVGNILGSKLDEEEAQEKLHEELMEIERQMTRAKKQKGEAG